jgi:hypothetical protein
MGTKLTRTRRDPGDDDAKQDPGDDVPPVTETKSETKNAETKTKICELAAFFSCVTAIAHDHWGGHTYVAGRAPLHRIRHPSHMCNVAETAATLRQWCSCTIMHVASRDSFAEYRRTRSGVWWWCRRHTARRSGTCLRAVPIASLHCRVGASVRK